jgi:UDP-N-acetylmuramoyl-L-alanyl-D-glutamate--2,6-diaminopimelate ligase
MPPLEALLKGLAIPILAGDPSGVEVERVTDDSRRAAPGGLFVAIEGTTMDGHAYLAQAAQGGAAAALVTQNLNELPVDCGSMRLIRVAEARRALALIAQRLAGDPSHAMTVVGVTGTKGKTSVAYLMEAIFEAAGMITGVMGTVSYRWAGHVELEPAPQTTPSPTDLADYLRRMREAGVRAVAMEVSSHAIEQRRADGIRFAACAMTNLTHEHLDYHHTMEDYARAKERLFTELLPENPDGVAVLNLDDEVSRRFVTTTRARHVLGFSMSRGNAHVCLKSLRQDADGMTLEVAALGQTLDLRTPMLGTFNAANCLAALALGLAVGIDPKAIAAGIAKMPGAPGRFEFVRAGQPFGVIVDYAHAPDPLEKLLENARALTPAPGRLIVVFGAGGDRDNSKRPMMGEAAARLADVTILTDDNPRTEDREKIAAMVAEGIRAGLRAGHQWHQELDRRRAIEEAIKMAKEGDTVVIAGKGHENYQIVGKEKHHFDDREVAREILMAL